MRPKTERIAAKALLYGGGLMLATSFCLFNYNLWDDSRAADEAQSVVREMNSIIWADENWVESVEQPVEESPAHENAAAEEMPTEEIEGYEFVGRIDIPALGLSLPVMNEWNRANLKIAPCRYEGSAYRDNMVITAQNYKTHFGRLKSLAVGSRVIFTDMDGNHFFYQVSEIEQLDGKDVEKMEEGDWDLTLFTCTVDGFGRVTVRCTEIL
jgi:sortase A